ncbi:hypothetical protein ABZ419_31000 [Streptomyces cinnamoneus]|uniref:hypothetical protein n=1 Tax=Streptomyces cinnamoneus TaxID=53446 RepID=UPI0033F956F9
MQHARNPAHRPLGERPAVRSEVSAIAARMEQELSGPDCAVGITLTALTPLTEGFPPRSSLTRLARTVAHPEDVTTVHPIKPPSRWPHALRQAVERAAHRDAADARPTTASAGAVALAATLERHLGVVRMAGDAVLDEDSDCPTAWRKDFVLVTATHVALLSVTVDD